jgi:pilus assembly protein CpaF
MSNRVVDMLRPDADGTEAEAPGIRAKRELHAELVASLDLGVIQSLPRRELEAQIRQTLTRMVHGRALPMTREQQADAIEEILDEVLGFGPLQRLLREPGVTDIMVNGPDTIFVERAGKVELANVQFRDAKHLMHVIDRIVGSVGRRIDESSPMVDARLPDGSRFNAIIPPVALDGPMVSIRRFGTSPMRRDDLVALGSVPEPVMELLEGCVRAKMNMLISGGAGSGKTTLLNVLSSFIPEGERVVTVEDAAELSLQQRHVVRLETRPPNLEGFGQVTARDLLRNALRMRPDRIIVGEIRGDEAIDMLQAMNTGHEGSIGTIHANSPRHALSRLETIIGLTTPNLSNVAIREMIADTVNLVLQVQRHSDGRRRLVSIVEIKGIENGHVVTSEVFRFHRTSIDAAGHVVGVHEFTEMDPRLTARFTEYGVELPTQPARVRLEA